MANAILDQFRSGAPITTPGSRRTKTSPPRDIIVAESGIPTPLLLGAAALVAFLVWRKFK